MKKVSHFIIVLLIIIAIGFFPSFAQKSEETQTVKIFGRVTDFNDQAIEGATVELKDVRFSNVAATNSGPDGRYSLVIPKGHYMALTAVKNYQARSLEYWAWNVPAVQEIEINPRFDRLEVYAINAWRPQGAYPSYQIYFRPMSLSAAVKKVTEAGGLEKFRNLPVMDIAPELGKSDIAVLIDGQPVNVLELNKVREASGLHQSMFGYLIQVTLPEKKTQREYSVITITLTDPVTGEKGEGCLFFRANGLP
jgi:hypothetical protein